MLTGEVLTDYTEKRVTLVNFISKILGMFRYLYS
jgi:hypothetical protein